jgi:hypothetical protein
VRSHRAVWELLRGPIPEGLVLDHLCRNKACCNPAHLQVVTVEENASRGSAAPIADECPHGHAMTPENLGVVSTTQRRYCKACRRRDVDNYKRRRAAAAEGAPQLF